MECVVGEAGESGRVRAGQPAADSLVAHHPIPCSIARSRNFPIFLRSFASSIIASYTSLYACGGGERVGRSCTQDGDCCTRVPCPPPPPPLPRPNTHTDTDLNDEADQQRGEDEATHELGPDEVPGVGVWVGLGWEEVGQDARGWADDNDGTGDGGGLMVLVIVVGRRRCAT